MIGLVLNIHHMYLWPALVHSDCWLLSGRGKHLSTSKSFQGQELNSHLPKGQHIFTTLVVVVGDNNRFKPKGFA